jgi:hypothetical protein
MSLVLPAVLAGITKVVLEIANPLASVMLGPVMEDVYLCLKYY